MKSIPLYGITLMVQQFDDLICVFVLHRAGVVSAGIEPDKFAVYDRISRPLSRIAGGVFFGELSGSIDLFGFEQAGFQQVLVSFGKALRLCELLFFFEP